MSDSDEQDSQNAQAHHQSTFIRPTIGRVGPTYELHLHQTPPSNTDNVVHRSSITNVCESLPNLKETIALKEAFEKVKDEKKVILIFSGVPGSGKSQLVRSLAAKFPYSNSDSASSNSLSIQWHIQCKDTGDDLKKEFLHLAEKLQESHFAETGTKKSLEDDFKKNQAKSFAQTLLNCMVPVLLIIEDPQEKQREFLQNFFSSVHTKFQVDRHSVFHIYVTSRSKSSVVPQCMLPPDCCSTHQVKGFTEKEAIEFLRGAMDLETDTDDDLRNVYKRFSGLPLGLLAAKGFCQYSGLGYKKYLRLTEDNSYDIMSDEKEAIKEEYGQAAEHVFQAIVMPFSPSDDSASGATNSSLHWQILCCICYFHYDRLPRFLLEQCCHVIRKNKVKNPELRNEADIGILVRKLSELDMCTKAVENKIPVVTFHEVVVNAFRLSQGQQQGFYLKKAMETMCRLVSLDLRRKENSTRMYKLRPHIQALLHHVETYKDMIKNDPDSEFIKAVTSHLYQNLAAIMLSESQSDEDETNKMFQESYKKIWPDMLGAVLPLPANKKPEAIADEVIKKSKQMGDNLPSGFINKYASWIKLCYFDEDDMNFLKAESKGDFAEVENILKSLDSTKELVEKLKDCKLFLSYEIFHPIFFAERFASILHTWSRYFLFRECEQGKEKCFWMNSLSKAVSIRVKSDSSIPLLTEWLSQIGGLIPLLLKQKDNPESLQDARKLCQDMIKHDKLKMYENGLLTEAFRPQILTRISLLRYIVRINTRLVKSLEKDKGFLRQADENCQDLFKLTTSNVDYANGVAYVIYCGKYYAAKKNFAQALTCFTKFFHLSSQSNFKQRSYISWWAVYNYARAVRCSASSHDREDAIRRTKEVLDSNKDIQEDLRKRLCDELNYLQNVN